MTYSTFDIISLNILDWFEIISLMIGHFVCLILSSICFFLDEFIGLAITYFCVGVLFVTYKYNQYFNEKTLLEKWWYIIDYKKLPTRN